MNKNIATIITCLNIVLPLSCMDHKHAAVPPLSLASLSSASTSSSIAQVPPERDHMPPSPTSSTGSNDGISAPAVPPCSPILQGIQGTTGQEMKIPHLLLDTDGYAVIPHVGALNEITDAHKRKMRIEHLKAILFPILGKEMLKTILGYEESCTQ